ncbi:MAG: hypothetical protein ACQEWM_10765 [Actinomycetota bacterium]
MEASRSPRAVHSEEEIARILLELAAIATDPESLRSWGQAPGVPLERMVAIETLTYVRLAGRDAHGDPIVLMLLDGAWERIF